MKLRKLLHIKKGDIHVVCSLNPLFIYKLSKITSDFISKCLTMEHKEAICAIKSSYSTNEFQKLESNLMKIENSLFTINENLNHEVGESTHKVSTLTLNTTRKCNLKCTYCFENEIFRNNIDMDFKTAQKAIDTFFVDITSNYSIVFTGGEPLLNYKLIKKIVEYVESKKIKVIYKIKTNATLLNEDKMIFLMEKNFKIQISLDGDKQAHDTHRKFANGKGSFDIVNKALLLLIEKGYSSNITISGTITHQTINFINSSYDNLNSYNGISYSLKPVMHDTICDQAFDSNDYKINYHAFVKNNKQQMKVKINQNSFNRNSNICGIGIWNITIDIDGKIYPCYRLCGEEKYLMGDIYSLTTLQLADNIKDIYYLEHRRKCSQCYFISICKSGCYVEKLKSEEKGDCINIDKSNFEDMIYEELVIKGMHQFIEMI